MIDWDSTNAIVRDVFGEAVNADPSLKPTYRPVIGAPFPINGVFDDAFLAVTMLDDASDFSTVDPIMGVRLSDFPAGVTPAQNDKVFIPRVGTTYFVRNVQPDGKGWALLDLMFSSKP